MNKKNKYTLIKAETFALACGLIAGIAGYTSISNEDESYVESSIRQEIQDKNSSSNEDETEKVIQLTPIETEQAKYEDRVDTGVNVYFTVDTELYDNVNGNVLSSIEIYNKAYEIFSVNNWSLLDVNGVLVYTPSENIDILGNTYAEVDIGDQNVKLYVDNELLVDTDVVTGKNSSPTHTGIFDIWYMEKDRYLTGPGYKSWVNYFAAFDNGIGFHDASWRNEFGGEIYSENGSHGCVNMPYDDAKELYENIEIGTKVLVHN